MNAVVPRATVTAIVAQRDKAIALYSDAHLAIQAAADAVVAARTAAVQAAPGAETRYNHLSQEERSTFLKSIAVPDRETYLADARRLTDIDVWAKIIALTDIERLMDKTAKDTFTRQLRENPPEVTEENVWATLQQLALDADTIFQRGIAEVFSNLDRRFRSHDGFKIGSRVILSYAFNEWGGWSYHRNHRDTLQDIERTFFILDGKTPPPNYGGIVGAVEAARRDGRGAHQSVVESDFFRIRCFKNGNAHVWFLRDDLVEKVNRLLADYYGEVLGDGQTDDTEEVFAAKTTPARYYGFFPTPDAPAADIVEAAALHRHGQNDGTTIRVLEPSAGSGNLARLCAATGASVDCIEIQPDLARGLRAAGLYSRVTCADFLSIDPLPVYDRVVMNPPFDRERDIDHVLHALRFLKPEGLLVTIMSAGTELRETRKATRFREVVAKLGGRFRDLPARSFASVGTNVNTVYLRVYADGRRVW